MTCYIIDTETTTSDRDRLEIIELAFLEMYDIGSVSTLAITKRFKPTGAIDFGALATHHILPEELNDCPPSSHAALPPDAEYIIGHNVDFDWAALGSPPVRRICTMAMARAVWPTLDSHKLGALVYKVNGVTANTTEYLRDAHSAGADCFYCNTVLNGILTTRPEIQTIHQLWLFSQECRIPKVMTFGKYKDQPVEAVDRGWVSWYRRQNDTDPYLIEAFDRLGR